MTAHLVSAVQMCICINTHIWSIRAATFEMMLIKKSTPLRYVCSITTHIQYTFIHICVVCVLYTVQLYFREKTRKFMYIIQYIVFSLSLSLSVFFYCCGIHCCYFTSLKDKDICKWAMRMHGSVNKIDKQSLSLALVYGFFLHFFLLLLLLLLLLLEQREE